MNLSYSNDTDTYIFQGYQIKWLDINPTPGNTFILDLKWLYTKVDAALLRWRCMQKSYSRLFHCLSRLACRSLFLPPANVFSSLFFFTSVQAFCETLEESNYRLQKELLEKQKEIASLKRRLQEREKAILLLEKHIKSVDVVDTRTTQEMGIRVGKKSNAPKKNELYKQPRAAS